VRDTLGSAPRDKVVLWAGGVCCWFDPLTLLHAVHALRDDHQDLRLVFLGMRHPNPDVSEMAMAGQTRRLAQALSLPGEQVFSTKPGSLMPTSRTGCSTPTPVSVLSV
jgi:hypothetical protein